MVVSLNESYWLFVFIFIFAISCFAKYQCEYARSGRRKLKNEILNIIFFVVSWSIYRRLVILIRCLLIITETIQQQNYGCCYKRLMKRFVKILSPTTTITVSTIIKILLLFRYEHSNTSISFLILSTATKSLAQSSTL